MKKVFVNMVFAFCFALMFGTKAYAQTPQQVPLTVLSNKTWTINLNKEVSATKENLEKHIYIYRDDTKQRVPIKVWADPKDKRKIYVSPNGESKTYENRVVRSVKAVETDYSKYLPNDTWKILDDDYYRHSVDGVEFKGILMGYNYECPNGEFENNKNFTLVVAKGLKGKNGSILKVDYTKKFRALRVFNVGNVKHTGHYSDEVVDLTKTQIAIRTTSFEEDPVFEYADVNWEKDQLSESIKGIQRVNGHLKNFDPKEKFFDTYYELSISTN